MSQQVIPVSECKKCGHTGSAHQLRSVPQSRDSQKVATSSFKLDDVKFVSRLGRRTDSNASAVGSAFHGVNSYVFRVRHISTEQEFAMKMMLNYGPEDDATILVSIIPLRHTMKEYNKV